MKKRILVVDDEQMIIDTITIILEEMGYEVHGLTDPVKAVDEAVKGGYDLILLDLRMPEMNGAEVAASILKERPDAVILIQTGYPTDPLAQKALEAGAQALLKKPFEIGKVLDFLRD